MKRLILLMALASLAACTSPVDAAGSYTMSVTFRENGCNVAGWTVGSTATNIHGTFTQSGDGLTADFMDVSAFYLDAVTGEHVFSGKVSGNDLDLMLHGTRSHTTGNCAYFYDARLEATLEHDALTGQIHYIGAGNGSPDCAGITGCISTQDLNGTRPPT